MGQEKLPLSLKDQIFVSPLGQWVYHRRNLLVNIGIFVVTFLAWTIFKSHHSTSVLDIRQSEKAFLDWKQKPEDEKLFQAFKSSSQFKEMERNLAGQIAQLLLLAGKAEEAFLTAQTSLRQLHSIVPEYAEFSEISLLIAQKHYQDALERSVSLKEKLPEQSTLFEQNLVRIAFLQQQLNNSAGELAAWIDCEKLKNFSILSSKSVPFQSYIDQRKDLLSLVK